MSEPLERIIDQQMLRLPEISSRKAFTLVLACSGGGDSVVLAHLLSQWANRNGIRLRLILAHLHHGLRGWEADRDAAFVRQLARRLECESVIHFADIRACAMTWKKAHEEAGRIARYRFFSELMARENGDLLCTAHHLRDHVESVLLNIRRGANVNGYSGIKVYRNAPYPLLRPLLSVSPDVLQEYAARHRISFCTDRSNRSAIYRRNFLRLKVLPDLEARVPELESRLLRFSCLAGRLSRWMGDCGLSELMAPMRSQNGNVFVPREELERRPFHVAGEVLQAVAKSLSGEEKFDGIGYYCPLEARHIRLLIEQAKGGKTGSQYDLPGGLRAHLEASNLVLCRGGEGGGALTVTSIASVSDFPVSMGEVVLQGAPVWIDDLSGLRKGPKHEEYINLKSIQWPLELRSWQEGDRFRPLGMNHSVLLSDFFTNLKIPRHRRLQVPVLVDRVGIIAVLPYRIADRVRVPKGGAECLNLWLESQGDAGQELKPF